MSQTYPAWPETVFPDNLDEFKQFVDILASDGPTIQKYLQAMYVGNQALASQYLSQIPNSAQKIVTANDLNKMVQAIKALEQFYRSDIQDTIGTLQDEWEATINRFSYQGVWTSNVSYYKNNLVSYSIGGIQYVFLSLKDNNKAVTPSLTNNQNWAVMTVQGEKGDPGASFPYAGDWVATSEYGYDDVVTYDGALYRAILPNQNVVPSSTPATWTKIMELEQYTIPIGPTKPSNMVSGSLWFDTSTTTGRYHYLNSLTSPATASDIAKGKQAYDQNGNLLIGTKA